MSNPTGITAVQLANWIVSKGGKSVDGQWVFRYDCLHHRPNGGNTPDVSTVQTEFRLESKDFQLENLQATCNFIAIKIGMAYTTLLEEIKRQPVYPNFAPLENASPEGVKHDSGKPEWAVLPWESIEQYVKELSVVGPSTGHERDEFFDIKLNALLREYGYNIPEQVSEWHMLPFEALLEVVRVFEHGKKEYGEDNWKQGFTNQKDRFFNATMRHMMNRYIHGNELSDHGFFEYAHEAWYALCGLWFTLKGDKK